MSHLRKIDSILKNQPFSAATHDDSHVVGFAAGMAAIENCVVVVSDLKLGSSRIYSGAFGCSLGIRGYKEENSIWEKEILDLMDDDEQEEKYLAEMRFFNYLRRLPKKYRPHYYLLTRLRFKTPAHGYIEVLHRMYYSYETDGETVRYGICVYSPLSSDIAARSMAVNSVTGQTETLTSDSDSKILSPRECQILSMIERGLTSSQIADELGISRYTVSRHRQEVIARLQVRNSTEACRIARQLKLI